VSDLNETSIGGGGAESANARVSSTPVITIGITTFNRPQSLLRAVESVLAQPDVTPGAVELIIVDDASTLPAASQMLTELRSREAIDAPGMIRIVRHEVGSGGPSAGRNDVITMARGEFILFLDDDNRLSAGSLSPLLTYLAHSTNDYVSLRRRRGDRSSFYASEGLHDGLTRDQVLWTFLVGGAFRTRAVRRSGVLFDPQISNGEDCEFVLEFVISANGFAALSDRDYVVEGDPGPDELPHISRMHQGVEFARILVNHVDRLVDIVARADLSASERSALGKRILHRSVSSYKMLVRFGKLSDDSQAHPLLTEWMTSIQRLLTDPEVRDWAHSRGMESAIDAALAHDLDRVRRALAP